MNAPLPNPLPAPWLKFIAFCMSIGHGELERVKIQDGVPVLVERVLEKFKL